MQRIVYKGRFLAIGAAAGLAFAGCAEAPEAGGGTVVVDVPVTEEVTEEVIDTPAAEATPIDTSNVAEGVLPCIVSDSGGFDDRSFNQLSYEGVQAAAEALGTDRRDVQSNSPTDFAPNIASLLDQGCNPIVTVGFSLGPATLEAAQANPDVHFIIVDETVDAPNVRPILFDTAQAAFLAGYLSAGYSSREGGASKVGTFGGAEFPTVTIFMDGFYQGVEYYNQEHGTNVEVVGWDGSTGSFTGGFEANQVALTTAQNIIDQGVDVLLPVGGPIYQSALAAIQDSGRDIALIGVDADLYETDPSTRDYLLTSILKKMDVATKEAVMDSATGAWHNEPFIGTLENNGVGIAPFHNFQAKLDPELISSVDTIRQRIIDGDVTVDSYLAN